MEEKDVMYSKVSQKGSATIEMNMEESESIDKVIDEHQHKPLPPTMTGPVHKSYKQHLKYISLVTLTIQNASLTLFMRAARTQKELFIASTAVIMSELIKLLTCLFMVYREEGKTMTCSICL